MNRLIAAVIAVSASVYFAGNAQAQLGHRHIGMNVKVGNHHSLNFDTHRGHVPNVKSIVAQKAAINWNHPWRPNHQIFQSHQVHFINQPIHYVQFYQFPFPVCWQGGQYWVKFNHQWIPYHYFIQHHAGAWQWHQNFFHLHNHVQFQWHGKPLVFIGK